MNNVEKMIGLNIEISADIFVFEDKNRKPSIILHVKEEHVVEDIRKGIKNRKENEISEYIDEATPDSLLEKLKEIEQKLIVKTIKEVFKNK